VAAGFPRAGIIFRPPSAVNAFGRGALRSAHALEPVRPNPGPVRPGLARPLA